MGLKILNYQQLKVVNLFLFLLTVRLLKLWEG